MAVRSGFEDVAALVQKVGTNAAPDLGPALRQIAEEARPGGAREIGIVPAHELPQPDRCDKVPTAVISAGNCRKILRKRLLPFPVAERKWQKIATSSIWHADCYT